MKIGGSACFLLLAILLSMLGVTTVSYSTEPSRNGAPRVACGLDQPVVGRDRSVGATVFTDAPTGASPRYRWTASGGRFGPEPGAREATGTSVSWSANGARPGTYRLSVDVAGAAGSIGGCTLEIVVSEAARSAPAAAAGGLGSEAERDMLVHGSQESGNYGLVSYILLGARPDDSNVDRYRAVLKAWLNLEDIQLDAYFPTKQLNVTYVPVDREPPTDLSDKWVLDHYDYARARFLLSRLSESDRDGDGPFIVSALRPLAADHDAGPYIVQNFSAVPVSVVPNWMRQFRSQTTQQRVWQSRSIGTVALNMRTVIAVAAEGLPVVLESVSKWILVRGS